MEQPRNHDHPGEDEPFAGESERKKSWIDRRRDKIVAEIEANRRGEYTVPTWVLVVALIAMIVVICTFMLLA
jgi:hypothetical protein